MSQCWANVNYGDQILLYNSNQKLWVGTGGASAPIRYHCAATSGDWSLGLSSSVSSAEALTVLGASGIVSTGGPMFSDPVMLLDQSRLTGNVNSAFSSGQCPQPTNLFDSSNQYCPALAYPDHPDCETVSYGMDANISNSDAQYYQFMLQDLSNLPGGQLQAAPLSNFGQGDTPAPAVLIASVADNSNCIYVNTADNNLEVTGDATCVESANPNVFWVFFAPGFGPQNCQPNGPTNGPQSAIGLIPAATCSQQTDTGMLIGIIVGSLVLAIIAAVAVSFWNKRKKIKTAV
jgi:hypothetical protein